jgi:hypothetical protein
MTDWSDVCRVFRQAGSSLRSTRLPLFDHIWSSLGSPSHDPVTPRVAIFCPNQYGFLTSISIAKKIERSRGLGLGLWLGSGLRLGLGPRGPARIGLGPGFLYWLGKKHSSQWIYRLGKKYSLPGHATRTFLYWNHALTNHVLFVYISAYFQAEDCGCYQALDAVTYLASSPGYSQSPISDLTT